MSVYEEWLNSSSVKSESFKTALLMCEDYEIKRVLYRLPDWGNKDKKKNFRARTKVKEG